MFSSLFFDFYRDLKKNNDRDWFLEHKKMYEEHVKMPYEHFINSLIQEIVTLDQDILPDAKASIFRIYRDVRFSKDKTPYKTHSGALIGPRGRKDYSTPSFYVHISDDASYLYCGVYVIKRKDFDAIKEFIILNKEEYLQITTDKKFLSTMGQLEGDAYKIVQKTHRPYVTELPILGLKNFYFKVEIENKAFLKNDIIERCVGIYEQFFLLKTFLKPVCG